MANPAPVRDERRRVERLALRLTATLRDGRNSRVRARVIDMSTHGCRIECSATVEDGSWIWLGIAGLDTQYCRVVWHCQEFVGLEFERPDMIASNIPGPEGEIQYISSLALSTDKTGRHVLPHRDDDPRHP